MKKFFVFLYLLFFWYFSYSQKNGLDIYRYNDFESFCYNNSCVNNVINSLDEFHKNNSNFDEIIYSNRLEISSIYKKDSLLVLDGLDTITILNTCTLYENSNNFFLKRYSKLYILDKDTLSMKVLFEYGVKGQFTSSEINYINLNIETKEKNNQRCEISMFNNDKFLIVKNPLEYSEVKIYNSLGILVIDKIINRQIEIDINEMEKGIYFVYLFNKENNSKCVKKILIN